VVRSEAIIAARIEIDGVWYRQLVGFTGTPMPIVIAPGAQSSLGTIRPVASNMSELDTSPTRRLDVSAGPHRIRVQNAPEFPASQLRQAVESSSPELAKKLAGKDLPALISNDITVDIPEWSEGAERVGQGAVARNVGTMRDDDSELAEVGISATRIQPRTARDWVLCIPETYIKTQLTPAEQAREDNDPDVRLGREAVDRYLIADMTRDHFALSLNYGHSEDHGEEIWFFYSVDRTCSAFKNVTHDNVTMALKRKTGEIRYMAP
jgi:hypothetical protein